MRKYGKEATEAFERFWKAYPDNCPYKTVSAKSNCIKNFAEQRAGWQDAKAYDEKILEAVAAWKKSQDWTRDPKFIHAPGNFIGKRIWMNASEIPPTEEELKKQREEEEAKQRAEYERKRAEVKDERLRKRAELEAQGVDIWKECRELCANFVDGECCYNATLPPPYIGSARPTENCRLYLKRESIAPATNEVV